MKLKITLLFFVTISLMFPLVHAPSESFSVPPLTIRIFYFEMNKGETFVCKVSATGGSGNDIDVRLNDPLEKEILYFPRVIDKTFSFQAKQTGNYTISFDNSFSILSAKRVSIDYSIESELETLVKSIRSFPLFSIILGLIFTIFIITYQFKLNSLSTNEHN